MADKTKIDWADASWNPITGCLHGCEYCYARRMVHRFGGLTPDNDLHVLDEQNYDARGNKDIYPFGFAPTFHRYRMDFPIRLQRPRTIFVCSMADLFGDWVPDEWIEEVFKSCAFAMQHRYLFLTKNPKRYIELDKKNILPRLDNFWYGTSAPTHDTEYFFSDYHHTFVSIEPILGDFPAEKDQSFGWAIIGAETGNRKARVVPDRSWVDHVVESCRRCGIPVFMKESLHGIMGDDFVQEYPWEA